MDQRPDTLSSSSSGARFPEQWAFLSNPPAPGASAAAAAAAAGTGTGQHGHWHGGGGGQTRSVPGSSYMRSDRSSSNGVSPVPAGPGLGLGALASILDRNASRSSLPSRNMPPAASVGGGAAAAAHQSAAATLPTQPVLILINSADAARHLHPAPRAPTRRPVMNGGGGGGELPPLQEYSFERILATIAEDVAEDVAAVGEILGRSRFVLADQHDSHLPPTGEIRAGAGALQAVAEAGASNEFLGGGGDHVLIANDEASLIEGSQAGSAAYGLLERLQALHRTSTSTRPTSARPARSSSPPTALFPADAHPLAASSSEPGTAAASIPPPPHGPMSASTPHIRHPQRPLFHGLLDAVPAAATTTSTASRTTRPVVSEVLLAAGAGGRVFSDPPVVSESGGRFYPLYSYDESEVFENVAAAGAPAPVVVANVRWWRLPRPCNGAADTTTTNDNPEPAATRAAAGSDAESQLRRILLRQAASSSASLLPLPSTAAAHQQTQGSGHA